MANLTQMDDFSTDSVVHERLKQFEHIALEHARLRHLIDYAAQGGEIESYSGQNVLYVDPQTLLILNATPTVLALLGYAADQLIGCSIQDLETISEDGSITPCRYVESSIQEDVYAAYYRHQQGHKVLVEVHKRSLNKSDGAVLHYYLEDRPLVRRLWQELERREHADFKFQQKLTSLTEITLQLSQIDSFDALCQTAIRLGIDSLSFDRLGMWFVDLDHRVMVGSYGVDELGQVRAEHQLRWSYAETDIEDFIAGKREVSVTHSGAPIYNDKSEIIEYGWHISAPLLHGNRFIGVLTSDNYLRKQHMKPYEPELLRLYAITLGHLTELIRMRDQTLAMRLKQERNQMLRQFITNVGHDFKTPLSAINTKSFLLQRTSTPEKREALAQGIEQQVMYISKTLDDMLEFIELERDLVLRPMMSNLHWVVNEVVAKYRLLGEAKRLQWHVTLDQQLRIRLDSYYFQRALGEILENALEYTPEGGAIYISTINAADQRNEVGVRVRDTGIGIALHALDKIFQPLYRVDEARTERRSGFGLTIAKTIMDAHRGRIAVNSTLGLGSTFELFLPCT